MAHRQQQRQQQQRKKHLECPFCQFYDSDEYVLLLHIEALHTENSPFVVKEERKSTTSDIIGRGSFNPLDYEPRKAPESEEMSYVLCPESGCGESVMLMELQTHLDFHDAEQISMEDVRHEWGYGSSSGSSSGNSPASSASSRKETVVARGSMLMEREKSGNGSGKSGKENGSSSRSSSGTRKRERKESRSLVISRDGIISREVVIPRDAYGRREHDDRDMGKARESDRGREKDRDRGFWYRSVYKDSEPLSSPVVATRHQSPRKVSYPPGHHKDNASTGSSSSSSRRHEKSTTRSNTTNPYNGSGVKRLGKSDLGPYAHEQQMPDWLRKELEKGGKVSTHTKIDSATGTLVKDVSVSNETPDLLPVIAFLCERDPNVKRAWLCHPGVKHVGKQIKGEGGFCGYRNIQMMISYIQDAFPRGSHPFEGRIPSILRIQDWIEEGWDKGINPSARLETGGIRGTRKYIGTSEAQTLLASHGIPCRPFLFNRSEGLQTQNRLLDFVESYFESGIPQGQTVHKVSRTHKPPMYFQHSGHSMTIVGIEKTLDGMRSLLVFDPFFTPSLPMRDLIEMRPLKGRLDSEMLLRAYRRGMRYLQKYKEFELIRLDV